MLSEALTSMHNNGLLILIFPGSDNQGETTVKSRDMVKRERREEKFKDFQAPLDVYKWRDPETAHGFFSSQDMNLGVRMTRTRSVW